ncbi:hypothetical protein E2C01_077736 [Portunus trituberculatus]|uniref:Uncharacterized protein n=1 Tax=Portunus trituberculatus TaxID=210409 RepID=A0A5B7IN40_PORTR|nr:hypothetical protein [Portunus trituberculatus]
MSQVLTQYAHLGPLTPTLDSFAHYSLAISVGGHFFAPRNERPQCSVARSVQPCPAKLPGASEDPCAASHIKYLTMFIEFYSAVVRLVF